MSPRRAALRERPPALSTERLVLIDETWATTTAPLRPGGRGQRVINAVST